MKKVFMLAMVALMTLAVSNQAQAIENPNPKGTTVIGIRAGYYPGFGVNVVGDYTLIDSWWKGHFTVGGYVGYNGRHYHYDYGYYGYRSNYMNFAVMPRVTYGLNITKDFEVHAGLMAGINYQINNWVYDGGYLDNEHYSHTYFSHGEVLGARYMFTPKFGAEFELVYSGYQSYLNFGVTMKL